MTARWSTRAVYVLKGVPNRAEEFDAETADYYDLVIGLHAA